MLVIVISPFSRGVSSRRKPQSHGNRSGVASSERRSRGEPSRGEWGDQGDGSYANPIMPGDFSDLDTIRVGMDYYAIASTMQYSPGMAVLHSHDLVNWKIVGHVVKYLNLLDPALNWDRMDRAGRGIWAGAIRYHDKKFWTYFGTPDQGIFMSTATDPAGPWTRPKLILNATGWDDPCPFWDDDGQGYLVTTHFALEDSTGQKYNIHLFKMNGSGDRLLTDTDRIIHQSEGSEANKLYKVNGSYYHFYSDVSPEGRVITMERSRRSPTRVALCSFPRVSGTSYLTKVPATGKVAQVCCCRSPGKTVGQSLAA
jgi:beta-xylosidase